MSSSVPEVAGLLLIIIGLFIDVVSCYWEIGTLIKGKGPSRILLVPAILYGIGLGLHGKLLFEYAFLDFVLLLLFHGFIQVAIPKFVSLFVDNRSKD